MKSFATFTILTLAIASGAVQAGPISVSGNNVGDIVTVGVNLQADVDTKIDTTIVNVLVALLTKVGDVNMLPPPEQIVPALLQMANNSGEVAETKPTTELEPATKYVKGLMEHFKEHPEQLKQLLSSESAGKLIEQFLQ